LQQTQVETVIPYYERFIGRFPTLRVLADSHLDDVLGIWQGLGYYQRARNIHLAARQIISQHNGIIPKEREAFLKLPGAGEYITAAVLSIAFNRPLAVLDGNVIRVVSRFWGIRDLPVCSKDKQLLRQRIQLDMPAKRPGDFNQAMMELGAMVCRSRNCLCQACPLRSICFAFNQQLVHEYPARKVRRARPRYRVALAVIRDGGRILIQKRKEEGHLGGLWEFPGGKVKEGEDPEMAVVRECHEEINCEFNPQKALQPFLHTYTHFEIEIFAFIGYLSAEPRGVSGQPLHWMDPAEKKNFAFPAANQRIFDLLDIS